MKITISNFISYPVLVTLVGMLALNIPFLGTLILLPTLGLLELYDAVIPGQFGETGPHVEIGFAWIALKTPQAWLFYTSFFFIIGMLLAQLVNWFNGRRFSYPKSKSLACSILVIFGLSIASYLLVEYIAYSAY